MRFQKPFLPAPYPPPSIPSLMAAIAILPARFRTFGAIRTGRFS
jgi:hypothetical protein